MWSYSFVGMLMWVGLFVCCFGVCWVPLAGSRWGCLFGSLGITSFLLWIMNKQINSKIKVAPIESIFILCMVCGAFDFAKCEWKIIVGGVYLYGRICSCVCVCLMCMCFYIFYVTPIYFVSVVWLFLSCCLWVVKRFMRFSIFMLHQYVFFSFEYIMEEKHVCLS